MLVGLRGVRHTRTGRVLIALRDNERGAQAYGVDVVRAKLTAFAISGFVAAFAGALFVHHQQAFGSGPYEPSENLAVFAMAVVGGIDEPAGRAARRPLPARHRWFLPLEWQFLASRLRRPARADAPAERPRRARSSRSATSLRWVAGRRDIVVPSLLADRADDREPDAGDEADAAPGTVGDRRCRRRRRPRPARSGTGVGDDREDGRMRQVRQAIAHPEQALLSITGGAPIYPLVVLFGLNAVDELDRTAFGVLLPEIRDEFGLGPPGRPHPRRRRVPGAPCSLQVPIATLADQLNRVRIAWIGAAAWGVVLASAPAAPTGIVFLAIARGRLRASARPSSTRPTTR